MPRVLPLTQPSGNIGTELAARATADGYTLLLNTLRLATTGAKRTPTLPDLRRLRKRCDERVEIIASSPAQFGAHIKRELARWAKVVHDNRIEPQQRSTGGPCRGPLFPAARRCASRLRLW